MPTLPLASVRAGRLDLRPLTGAIAGFGRCLAIVGYGIYLIVAH
ncbi:MAG TPA: hypothetical protein VGD84_25490 [Pseudonocardiaceae bacterium]